jgi:hypothetical protein
LNPALVASFQPGRGIMQQQQNAHMAVIFVAIIALTIAIDLKANVTWQEVVALVALIGLYAFLSLVGHAYSKSVVDVEKRIREETANISRELEAQRDRLRACEITRGINRQQ